MDILQACALFVAAIMAGALNSVAGGGTFITFPTLLFTGVPSINANATNTIAVFPGSLASVAAYRRELVLHRNLALTLASSSVIGGVVGSIVLINTDPKTFQTLIPYLLLLATLIFTFGSPFNAWLRKRAKARLNPDTPVKTGRSRKVIGGILVLQFITGIYGGFFGGGIGIVILATLALIGLENINEMNAIKTLLASCINGVATVIFIVSGKIFWPQAIVMIIGATIGGYVGAYYARKINPLWLRRFVIVFGFALTIYFFVKS